MHALHLVWGLLIPLILILRAPQEEVTQGPSTAPQQELARAMREHGVQLDLERGLLGIDVEVLVRNDLLEYVLVGPAGASHESLFATSLMPSVLNTALLTLGLEPGRNAAWTVKTPPPTEEEMRSGISPYQVTPPAGDGLLIYLAWKEGDDLYFFRLEDLIRNLASGRSMRRHEWIYLGSRLVPHPTQPQQEVFAADIYHNLICVSFFQEGYTLLTASLPSCIEQTIWIANAWLLPETGQKVRMVFAREPLVAVPADWLEGLPAVAPAPDGGR